MREKEKKSIWIKCIHIKLTSGCSNTLEKQGFFFFLRQPVLLWEQRLCSCAFPISVPAPSSTALLSNPCLTLSANFSQICQRGFELKDIKFCQLFAWVERPLVSAARASLWLGTEEFIVQRDVSELLSCEKSFHQSWNLTGLLSSTASSSNTWGGDLVHFCRFSTKVSKSKWADTLLQWPGALSYLFSSTFVEQSLCSWLQLPLGAAATEDTFVLLC